MTVPRAQSGAAPAYSKPRFGGRRTTIASLATYVPPRVLTTYAHHHIAWEGGRARRLYVEVRATGSGPLPRGVLRWECYRTGEVEEVPAVDLAVLVVVVELTGDQG